MKYYVLIYFVLIKNM